MEAEAMMSIQRLKLTGMEVLQAAPEARLVRYALEAPDVRLVQKEVSTRFD